MRSRQDAYEFRTGGPESGSMTLPYRSGQAYRKSQIVAMSAMIHTTGMAVCSIWRGAQWPRSPFSRCLTRGNTGIGHGLCRSY